jgi:hypothetical protein
VCTARYGIGIKSDSYSFVPGGLKPSNFTPAISGDIYQHPFRKEKICHEACLSARLSFVDPYGPPWFQVDGISWKTMLKAWPKYFKEIKIFLKSLKNNMKMNQHLMLHWLVVLPCWPLIVIDGVILLREINYKTTNSNQII